MVTATHSTSKKSAGARKAAGRRRTGSGPDAVALLEADHRAVEKLFAQFEKARDTDRKKLLADKICLELTIHAQIEEEIFYPTSREYLEDDDIVDEAVVEHAAAKELIAEIETMQPGEELYDAKVTVLQEQIEHHVKEEESEYFPKLRKTDMDMKAVGAMLKARKEELMGQMGGDRGGAVQ